MNYRDWIVGGAGAVGALAAALPVITAKGDPQQVANEASIALESMGMDDVDVTVVGSQTTVEFHIPPSHPDMDRRQIKSTLVLGDGGSLDGVFLRFPTLYDTEDPADWKYRAFWRDVADGCVMEASHGEVELSEDATWREGAYEQRAGYIPSLGRDDVITLEPRKADMNGINLHVMYGQEFNDDVVDSPQAGVRLIGCLVDSFYDVVEGRNTGVRA